MHSYQSFERNLQVVHTDFFHLMTQIAVKKCLDLEEYASEGGADYQIRKIDCAVLSI